MPKLCAQYFVQRYNIRDFLFSKVLVICSEKYLITKPF